MWMKKLAFSCAAVILLVNGCGAATSHVMAKDTSVEDWLEKDDPVKKEKSEHKTPAVNSSESSDRMSDTSLLFSLVKVVIVLGLILFLIYYVVKFLNKRNKMLQKVKAMENLGGVSVGTNKSVQIVRIGQQLYLLGVGDNVEMLKEITDPETKNSILKQQQDAGETAGPKVDIASLFAKKKTAQQADEGSNFRRQFMQELDKMKTTRQRILNEHQKDDGHE